MGRTWTPEQREAASQRMKEKNEAKKASDTSKRLRVPIGARRDVTAVERDEDFHKQYKERWVNDIPGRIEKFKRAGYELVETASVGDPTVDGTHNESGVVSKDMGQGTTAYLMRQRREYFEEDKAAKQEVVDSTEESMRRDLNENRNDGQYGEVKIGRK